MLTFDLSETQAENDVLKYNENHGFLVVKNNIPQLFIPLPKDSLDDWESVVRIDPDNVEEIKATTRIYLGIVDAELVFWAKERVF